MTVRLVGFLVLALCLFGIGLTACGSASQTVAGPDLQSGITYTTYAPAHGLMGGNGVAFKNTDRMKVVAVSGSTVTAELVTNDDRNGKRVTVPKEIFVKPDSW